MTMTRSWWTLAYSARAWDPGGGQLLASGYEPVLEGRRAIISFVTEAELRFGAAAAGWGPARIQRLEQKLTRARTVWATRQLVASYVELRAWCTRHGHGLAQKEHEADRWIAATARHLRVPLVAHDAIFRNLPDVELITRLPGESG